MKEIKSEVIWLRLDKKLREQLDRYCEHEDSKIASTARKALRKFLNEYYETQR